MPKKGVAHHKLWWVFIVIKEYKNIHHISASVKCPPHLVKVYRKEACRKSIEQVLWVSNLVPA
jgi:hypothetical protein